MNLPAGTVRHYDRQLSEAGLRTKSGRGRSAATVTPLDAANLLVALLVSSRPGSGASGAAQSVVDVQAFEAYPNFASATKRTAKQLELPALRLLPVKHTCQRFLAALIFDTASGNLGRAIPETNTPTNYEPGNPRKYRATWDFSLRFEWPNLSISVSLTVGQQRPRELELTNWYRQPYSGARSPVIVGLNGFSQLGFPVFKRLGELFDGQHGGRH